MAQTTSTQAIGLPLDGVDGPRKVTGKATYAYEFAGQGRAAYGVIVPAAIAKGRVGRCAQRAPGVLLVTKDNARRSIPSARLIFRIASHGQCPQ